MTPRSCGPQDQIGDLTRRERSRLTRQRRSRQVRTLLALGAVLGVGAGTTLAAWNDTEVAQGSVTAGTFVTETFDPAGAGAWRQTDEGSPASMTFSLPSGLAPGQHSYAVFSVRTRAGSVPGALLFNGATANSSPLHQALRYGVRAVPNRTCNQAAFDAATGNIVVPTDSPLTTAAAQSQSAPTGETTVHYCIRLTLPSGSGNNLQGLTATPRFTVTGTSS